MDFIHVEWNTLNSTYLLTYQQGVNEGRLVCLAGTLAYTEIPEVDVQSTLRQVIDSERGGINEPHLVDGYGEPVCTITAVQWNSVKVYAPAIAGDRHEARCLLAAHTLALRALTR